MKKSILCVHQGYELYGSDRSFITSVAAIKEKYADRTIDVMIPKQGPIVSELEKLDINLIIRDMGILRKTDMKKNPLFFFLAFIRHFFFAVKATLAYEFVYINTIVVLDYILASILIRKKGIIHIREIQQGKINLFFSALLRLSSYKLIFNSKATKESFRFGKVNSVVIDNGVNDLGHAPLDNEEPIKLLLIGRFNSWKGQDFFLESFAALPEAIQKCYRVRLVGDVFESNYAFVDTLKTIIADAHIESYISIEGFTEDPAPVYKWADAVIVPSKTPEPFGRVAVEAMSTGRPVIAAAHGGLKDIVTDKASGFLFEPNNTASLNDVLGYITTHRDTLTELGCNARRRYETHYTAKCYSDTLKNEIP